MAKIQMNLQDSFLNAARRQNALVTVSLTDGSKIKGKVNGFDNFTVILDVNHIQHLLYKHAIAAICPDKPLEKHMNATGSNGVAHQADKNPMDVSPEDLERLKAKMENR